jgi:hypothetical protein
MSGANLLNYRAEVSTTTYSFPWLVTALPHLLRSKVQDCLDFVALKTKDVTRNADNRIHEGPDSAKVTPLAYVNGG